MYKRELGSVWASERVYWTESVWRLKRVWPFGLVCQFLYLFDWVFVKGYWTESVWRLKRGWPFGLVCQFL